VKASATLPYWPLLLRREHAASYLGMSPGTFDAECRAGRMPAAIPITGTLKGWHRGDLDAWVEDRRALAAGDATPDTWADA
jgi:predicted DNA-binding transcriptional regulator AlpA